MTNYNQSVELYDYVDDSGNLCVRALARVPSTSRLLSLWSIPRFDAHRRNGFPNRDFDVNDFDTFDNEMTQCSLILLHNMVPALASKLMGHVGLAWSSLQKHFPCEFDTHVSFAALEGWFSERFREVGRWHWVLISCSSWIISDLDPVASVLPHSWRIDNLSRRKKVTLA